jgi:hypothetical protein
MYEQWPSYISVLDGLISLCLACLMNSYDTFAIALFRGSGEMHALARTLDWSQTPLGAISTWPQSLRSTVRTLLSSQYPMILMWGLAFTQIYNDAYAKLIGDKYPRS